MHELAVFPEYAPPRKRGICGLLEGGDGVRGFLGWFCKVEGGLMDFFRGGKFEGATFSPEL